MAFWRPAGDGVLVSVKVQPKSRRPGIQGRAPAADGERLRLGVTEAPEDGRANRAACALLAEVLHMPASSVSVAAGAASREKTLLVTGNPARIIEGLESL